MKKYIFAAAALFCGMFASCSNDDIDIDTFDKLTLNISTESMYDDLQMKESIKDLLRDGKYNICVQTFLYDKDGILSDENVSYAENTNPITVQFPSVKQGTYTLISVETMVATANNRKPYDWQISGKDKLSTLQIDQIDSDVYWYAALGVISKSITVSGTKTETITPQAIGNVIQTWFLNFDKANDVINVCVGTTECIAAYRLDPSLSASERVSKDLSKSGYFYLLGSKKVEDNQVAFTLYTLADNLNIEMRCQDSDLANSTSWYEMDNMSINLSKAYRHYLACYYSSSKGTIDSKFADNLSEINEWYSACLAGDQPIPQQNQFYDPYLVWNASVTTVQNWMNTNYSFYEMFSGEKGKGEEMDYDNDGVVDDYRVGYYNNDALIEQINYYFTNATTNLYEVLTFVEYDKMSLSQITADLASRYNYDSASGYYLSADETTLVAILDQETYAAIEYISMAYLLGSSAKGQGPMTVKAATLEALSTRAADRIVRNR